MTQDPIRAENEACAAIADGASWSGGNPDYRFRDGWDQCAEYIASAIRARLAAMQEKGGVRICAVCTHPIAQHDDDTEFNKGCLVVGCGCRAHSPETKIAGDIPDPQGFLPHDGGECPVAGDTKVFIRFRPFASGPRASDVCSSAVRADELQWTHSGNASDIIAYKPEPPTPKAGKR